MVHSVSGWTRGVQVKLWDPLRTCAIPQRFRGVFTTRRYTNPRLPLPLPLVCLIDLMKKWLCNCVSLHELLTSKRQPATIITTTKMTRKWYIGGRSQQKCCLENNNRHCSRYLLPGVYWGSIVALQSQTPSELSTPRIASRTFLFPDNI